GRHLLILVDQMLGLHRLESGKMELNMINGDIVSYMKYLIEAFHSYAGTKNIRLYFQAEPPDLIMDYDPEKVLQIISNLLSNAIKFSPEGGEVSVVVEKQGKLARIRVKDTGIGISEDQLPFIFDRFYQAPAPPHSPRSKAGDGSPKTGAGIGLAITRELIKLLDGDISVKSQAGKGTEFTIHLPITQQAAPMDKAIPSAIKKEISSFLQAIGPGMELEDEGDAPGGLPLALIIEDNPDVVFYLKACLQKEYRLKVAANGENGIRKAIEMVPDIIISDVVMPGKDGFEVTRALKKGLLTSHIPIILLTAKADVASRIEGLGQGADVYLAKPFHKEELLVRMKKLLELRQSLRAHYLSLAETASSGPTPREGEKEGSAESLFLKKIHAVIEDHLTDPKLNVDRLCLEMAMSHSQLHRKLTALTGYSPNRFIRYIRLTKAKTLLIETDMPVNFIAYDTGFNDPGYFSRAFRKEFDATPVDFRNRYRP
ncbi:MAG: helix-turn-helix domain-containing protein, partial [Phaeodactylibacter sp.]|nr:helix-turn-helix domain-containing protein [Phaeodactylibacter sp.]